MVGTIPIIDSNGAVIGELDAGEVVSYEKVEEYKITSNARRLGMTPDDYKIYVFQRASLKDELRQQHENDVMAMSSHGMPKTISNSELTYYRSAYKQTKSGNYKRLEVTRDGAAVPKTLPRVIPKRL
ncbi:hypothetical protein SDC9_209668 [bioreactor metagenome]|uniref:Uncharacterized protein n=1 Tax=bioreactor metagenome TaxID=1076179 RepID=A0A645JFE8_9ZZZZ